MDDDQFFADYGSTDLFIRGMIVSLSRHSRRTILELGTGLPTKVLCDLGGRRTPVRAGDTVIVESRDPHRDASRDAAGVLLRNCLLHKR